MYLQAVITFFTPFEYSSTVCLRDDKSPGDPSCCGRSSSRDLTKNEMSETVHIDQSLRRILCLSFPSLFDFTPRFISFSHYFPSPLQVSLLSVPQWIRRWMPRDLRSSSARQRRLCLLGESTGGGENLCCFMKALPSYCSFHLAHCCCSPLASSD